jgi:hypothetical protein
MKFLYVTLLRLLKSGSLNTALVLLCLQVHAGADVPPTSPPSLLHQQPNPWFLNHYSIISDSDFDGDHCFDVITGKREGLYYRVEIELSSQQEKTSFSLSNSDPLVQLSSRDVDSDNDQDLVLSSSTALYPLAIWLNDGKGNFQQGDPGMGIALITSQSPSSYHGGASQADPVCIGPDGRLPMDKSNAHLGATPLANVSLIVSGSEKSSLRILSDKLTARSPPPFSSV